MATAWRAVHPDLRSSRGFRWPWPGGDAVAPLPDGAEFTRGGPCPRFPGEADVLGEDNHKLRVSRCRVVDVFDASALIRDGWCAGADLGGANLGDANLWDADLRGADLWGADLGGANLGDATADRWTRWPGGFDPDAAGVKS